MRVHLLAAFRDQLAGVHGLCTKDLPDLASREGWVWRIFGMPAAERLSLQRSGASAEFRTERRSVIESLFAPSEASLTFGVSVPDGVKEAIQPEGVTGWDILLAVVIVLIAIPVGRGVDRLTRKLVKRIPDASTEAVHVAGHVARYGVWFLAWSLGLSLVGVEVGWAVAIAVVFLIMIVLILRPLIENSAAGLLLQARPSFAVGDHIEASGYRGEVIEINARTTSLKTPDGIRIHIPNTQVLSEVLVVYTAYEQRRVSVDLGVDPAADLASVTKVLVAAVSGVDTVLADPAPVAVARSFGDGTINLSVRFWFGPDTHSVVAVTDGAIRALQAAINDAGIGMPPPQIFVETKRSASSGGSPRSAGDSDQSGASDAQ